MPALGWPYTTAMLPSDSTTVAYAGAVGALAGVLLTNVWTAILGRVQRRHDRTNKLFETKLKLYSKLHQVIVDIKKAGERLDKLDAGDPNTTKELGQGSASTAPDGENSGFPEERMKQLLARRSVSESKARAVKEINEIAPLLLLIAEEDLSHQFELVIDRVVITGRLREEDINSVQQAARRELGVPAGRVRRWLLARKRQYRAWRLRSEKEKPKKEQEKLRRKTERARVKEDKRKMRALDKSAPNMDAEQ
jgi:hypothetical protein